MKKGELSRRYLLFLCAVFINAFSIAVITKAMLGTSPISSVPYVLSLFTPWSMGVHTIVINFLFIVLEMLMMKRNEIREKKYELLLQVPITICFGLFIDLSMYALGWLQPENYIVQLLTLLLGCFILGLGISFEVKANVAMVTGEYLVQVLSRFVHREFGWVKVCFDVTLVAIACLLSFLFLPGLQGVREGTVVAALVVGPIVHFLNPYMRIFDKWLTGNSDTELHLQSQTEEKYPLVITIAREYGSGGRELGRILAKELGIKFYDKELIAMVAKESRMPESYVSQHEQTVSSNYLLRLIMQDYEAPIEKSLSSADALFVSQSKVIRKIAKKESCVIIGRCADYILKDWPEQSIVRIFCYSDIESAYRRCVEEYHLDAATARSEIARINRARMNHYQHYTGRRWDDPQNYHLMVHTGEHGVKLSTACALIAQLYREKT